MTTCIVFAIVIVLSPTRARKRRHQTLRKVGQEVFIFSATQQPAVDMQKKRPSQRGRNSYIAVLFETHHMFLRSC